MSILYGMWVEKNQIIKEASANERKQEAERIPSHPRTELLEQDLDRAIRILNDAGFTLVRETEVKNPRIEVYHNLPSPYGGYSSGSTRMDLFHIGSWLQEQLSADKPVLVTKIVDFSIPLSERK